MNYKVILLLALLSLAVFAHETGKRHHHRHHRHHHHEKQEKQHDHPIKYYDQMVQYINSVQSGWVAGHNPRFTDKDLDFAKKQMGSLKPSQAQKLPVKMMDLEADVDSIPTSFNARDAWPGCESLFEVRDQANCGSCWAFATTEAISDRICIASGQKDQTRISSANLVTCCSSCGEGCNGGFESAAWQYWVDTGLVTGDLYNSTGKWCQNYFLPACDHHVNGTLPPCSGESETPACSKQCQAGYPVSYEQDLHHGASAYGVPANEAAIQKEIMAHGPVTAAFTVYSDFVTYKSGVYRHVTGDELGGHAIKIIGWGVENGQKYWLIVNSWNQDWGYYGTFKIVRGEDHCGIESGVNAGLPKLTTTI